MKTILNFLHAFYLKLFPQFLYINAYYKQASDKCFYRVTGKDFGTGEFFAFGKDFSGEWKKNSSFGYLDNKKPFYKVSEKSFVKELELSLNKANIIKGKLSLIDSPEYKSGDNYYFNGEVFLPNNLKVFSNGSLIPLIQEDPVEEEKQEPKEMDTIDPLLIDVKFDKKE